MLNLFKKKDEEGGPAAQVLAYQNQIVRLFSPSKLPLNQTVQLNLLLPGNQSIRANVVVLTQESQQANGATYMAELDGPPELGEFIEARFKAPAESTASAGERRRQSRVPHQIQILSKQLPGFMAMSVDISESGLRLATPVPMEPRQPLLVAFDVDDTTSAPIQIQAETVWCQPNDEGGYWVGIRFVKLPPGQEKAIEILNRAIKQMRQKPGVKAFSLEP